MNFLKNLSVLEIASLILAVLLILCLCLMPYGFYTIMRLTTAVISCCWAYQFYQAKKTPLTVIAISVAILFQPLLKIVLDRLTWNILDCLLALALTLLIYIRHKNKPAK